MPQTGLAESYYYSHDNYFLISVKFLVTIAIFLSFDITCV